MANKNLKEKIDISQRYSRKLISGRVTATNGIRNPHNMSIVYGLGANRIEVLRALEKQNKFRIIWYSIFLLLGVVSFAIEPKSWFYFLNLIVLMLNVDLVAQGKVIGIYLGIAECLMYIYLCVTTHLWGEVIKMCVINIPLNIFALISWTRNIHQQKKNGANSPESGDENKIVVRKVALKNYWWLILLLAILYVGCYFGLKLLNTTALIFSAGTLALTIYQKIFNALCYKESWWFSILGDFIGTAMWIEVIITSAASGSFNLVELPRVVATVACLVQGFYAYDMWKSMYRKVAVNGGEVLAMRKVKINKIIKLRRRYQQLYWDKNIDTNKNS